MLPQIFSHVVDGTGDETNTTGGVDIVKKFLLVRAGLVPFRSFNFDGNKPTLQTSDDIRCPGVSGLPEPCDLPYAVDLHPDRYWKGVLPLEIAMRKSQG